MRGRAGEFEVGENCGKIGGGSSFALLERPSPQNMGQKNTFQLKKKEKACARREMSRESLLFTTLLQKQQEGEKEKGKREPRGCRAAEQQLLLRLLRLGIPACGEKAIKLIYFPEMPGHFEICLQLSYSDQ